MHVWGATYVAHYLEQTTEPTYFTGADADVRSLV